MSDDHGHGDKPFLAHHFEDEDHQFDAGKLGIWAFLVTEILFFSGLFCAYAIYRATHPEVFQYAAQALDTKWGAINTGVLIFSSLTAAWAVRNAQLGQKKMLCVNLIVTILCAFGFMGIKSIEYSSKWSHGIYLGESYAPTEDAFHNAEAHAKQVSLVVPEEDAQEGAGDGQDGAGADDGHDGDDHDADGDHDHEGGEHADGDHADGDHADGDHADGDHGHDDHDGHAAWDDPEVNEVERQQLKIFFGIYYCMTGLHGIHVLLGILVLTWLLTRAMRGHFTPTYYGPIDYAALYWHIVDLIWIYLFPLLYLIN